MISSIPFPSDDIMMNSEQVAQIVIQNTSRYICAYWRSQERTILVEYVDEHEGDVEDTVAWFEIPDTMLIGDTVARIIDQDVYWHNDLRVFDDGEEADITLPMCRHDKYFNSRWLDYAEKGLAFQSTACLLPIIG